MSNNALVVLQSASRSKEIQNLPEPLQMKGLWSCSLLMAISVTCIVYTGFLTSLDEKVFFANIALLFWALGAAVLYLYSLPKYRAAKENRRGLLGAPTPEQFAQINQKRLALLHKRILSELVLVPAAITVAWFAQLAIPFAGAAILFSGFDIAEYIHRRTRA